MRIMELPLDYIDNPLFGRANAERVVLGPAPEAQPAPKKPRLPSGLPTYLASLYEVPLLTREQEVYLFRKLNFLKHRASKLRATLDPQHARGSAMDQIERDYEDAVATKNQIVRANLRLVVSIAKRHVGPSDNFFELVSDGNMSLIRAAEKFDFARGNKFSTYASWAIMKNFARTIPDELRHRDRYRTSTSEMFSATQDDRTDQYAQESAQRLRERQIGKILERLDEREQKIIISRFGLSSRSRAADAEGSRGGNGRHQGAHSADRGAGPGQAAAGRGRGKDRDSRPVSQLVVHGRAAAGANAWGAAGDGDRRSRSAVERGFSVFQRAARADALAARFRGSARQRIETRKAGCKERMAAASAAAAVVSGLVLCDRCADVRAHSGSFLGSWESARRICSAERRWRIPGSAILQMR